MASRLRLFLSFQVFAFSALISPAATKRAFKSAVANGIKPRPCREVLQAAWKLKLHNEEECANNLIKSVVW